MSVEALSDPRLLDDPKHRVLSEVFGFQRFRPGQEPVIDALMAGENVLTVMPTGAGKSLCFQVPALVLGGLTLVVSPLVALMRDQVAALRLAGVAAETINSGQSRPENVAAWRRVAAGEARLLYLSPERLMTERMLAALKRLPVNLLAIDEAHCISQWGPAFRPEYQALGQLRSHFPGCPLVALTATADAVTRRDIVAQLFEGQAKAFVEGFDRPNIRLAVAAKQDSKRQILEVLERNRESSGIVYCLSRRKTEATTAWLKEQGYTALPYHAGMEAAQRETHQNRFMTETPLVMVATIAFGMGIDKPGIRYVVHADLPGSLEAYYQEIGRAGRDGEAAEAHMLYGLDDIRLRRVFIEQEEAGEERRRREHQRLDALIAYCETPGCRRQALLGYFGEDHTPCGNCDGCLTPAVMADGTVEAAALLSVVRATGERFGAGHIIDVLRGVATEKALKAGHDRLSSFGSGQDHKKAVWQSLTRQLVATGFLHLDIQGFGGLIITEKGRRLLAGQEAFHYREDSLPKTPKTSRKAKATPRAEAPLSEGETRLLGQLKALRLRLAKDRGVPAYVVFSDRALIDMARRQPTSPEAFAEVHGVGAAKLKDFATPFLTAIAGFQVRD